MNELRPKLDSFDFFVFNGDTFDLAWSDRSSLEETVRDALGVLAELLSSYPRCNFFYLFGNHDCAASLVDGIRQLESDYSNLTSYHEYLILGKNLFLHGDVCNERMDRNGLVLLRNSYANVKPRSRFAQAIYQLIIWTCLNRVAYITHPRAKMIDRIHYYLNVTSPNVVKGIKRIFFGHTHAPFVKTDSCGIEFINTGSAIRGLRDNFCEFQVEEDS